MGKYDPIAYTYEADTHCPSCAIKHWGYGEDGFIGSDSTDSEGNPVGAVAPWEEWPYGIVCGTCGWVILEAVEADDESDEVIESAGSVYGYDEAERVAAELQRNYDDEGEEG